MAQSIPSGNEVPMLFDEDNVINKLIPVPLYFQLKELIVKEIKRGSYPVDSVIPTEIEISEHFKLSRTTVRQAIMELVNEGWLNRRKSKGTYVSRPSLKQDFIQRLETFNDQINRLGMVPRTEVLDLQVIGADRVTADKLDLQEGDKLVYLFRRRFADDLPVVLVETYLPYTACGFILEKDLSRESLYKTLSVNEKTRIYASHRIAQAVAADSKTAGLLDIEKGSPVHFFESVSTNVMGEKMEYSLAKYRGDKNKFEVTVYV